ncbi:MAG: ribosome maturation factor RimP [Chitinivibrionales bacterium]
MSTLKEIAPIIEDTLRFMQLFLYDIKFFRAGKRSVLRIFIDRPGGVTIDDCEKASNAISVILDVENFSTSPYTLEVSSPGLDRELRCEKDYKMIIGHYVRLAMKDAPDAPKEYVGKLVGCDNATISLEMDDEQTRTIALPDVVTGRIDVRFK